MTAKELYAGYTSTFPPPKVIFKFEVDWSLVWERLGNLSLDPTAKDYLFSIVHNIVPNRLRLYSKFNMVNSPNCLICGVEEDNTHLFMECVMVREAWGWVRMRLLDMLPEECAKTSNFEFLHLMFAKHLMDHEAVWLVGTYVQFVWVEKLQRRRHVKIGQLIGTLKLCYKANQMSRKPLLGFISNIN